jgi:SGNH domain-containing protein
MSGPAHPRPRLVRRASTTILLATTLTVAATSVACGAAAANPKCVGAAARDAKRPCFNPTRSATPSLASAQRVTSTPCQPVDDAPVPICTFGVAASKAKHHIALIGDSHALQWRSALDVVARSRGWRGYSLSAPGCPFSDAVKYLAEGARAPCMDWYRAGLRWFDDHPEVTIVFTSQFAPMPMHVPRGRTELQIKSAGFRRTWSSLPKTVERVIAIRDTPMTNEATADCLRHVIAEGRERPGIACRVGREGTVFEDAAVTTAKRLRSKRYGFVDLTSFFCGSAYCYPVIGGVLVYRDTFGHMTLDYAVSLGPYLLRRIRFLLG